MGISKRYDSQIMGRLHVSLRAIQVYINWHDYKMVFSEEKTPVPHDFFIPTTHPILYGPGFAPFSCSCWHACIYLDHVLKQPKIEFFALLQTILPVEI